MKIAENNDDNNDGFQDVYGEKSRGKKKDKKKDKSRKRKVNDDTNIEESILGGLDYAKLFKATGGIRCGMRARASQEGKWRRAEN